MTSFFPAVCVTALDRGCFILLLLLTYSFLGWCGEMVYCSIGQRRLCEKRGFLNGPLCPIYGHGAIVVLLALDGGCENPVWTFLLGALLTSLVEYVTSCAMEKLFHMRWWDYSHYRFHLNGRICLLNSTLFGLASVFLCHAANPPVTSWLAGLLASGVGVPLALILLVLYGADIVLSVRSAVRISDCLAKLHAVSGELAERLEELRREQQQALEAQRQRLEAAAEAQRQRLGEAMETQRQRLEQAAETQRQRLEGAIGDISGEFSARLEAARSEAQQKLRALYERQSFLDRRLLHAFPTMRSLRHGEALTKWREYLASRTRTPRGR